MSRCEDVVQVEAMLPICCAGYVSRLCLGSAVACFLPRFICLLYLIYVFIVKYWFDELEFGFMQS